MARDLDIIIFGATGFTGKHTIPLVAKFSKAKNRQLTWGVAGRSEAKLKDFMAQWPSLSDIPIIIANVEDEHSLREMARKARIIINCCGPWTFYGEPVVKACVEEGTHHVDVSGEHSYMEKMELKYHSLAEKKGVYVVSACGFDSVPADLGVVFMQQKFKGTLNSVVTYLDGKQEGEPLPGPSLNYGTWESAVNELGHAGNLEVVRRQLYPNPLPSLKPKLKVKVLHKNNLVEGWAVPFPGSDRTVIQRSQRNFYEKDSKRPIQIETYFIVKSLWNILIAAIFGSIFLLLTKFKCGRKLLLKHPEGFSNGFFSHEQPSEEKIERTVFSITFYGEGWKENLSDRNNDHSTPPDGAIAAIVKGRNPGYGATCVSLVLSAITIITETEKMPSTGGVYTPGYAFAKTSLIEELNENGLTFDVLFEKDLKMSK